MQDVLGEAAAWAAAGESVVVATVVETRRSAPRPPGSKLAVSGSGQIAGGVSGGCVESAVLHAAREVMASGHPQGLEFGLPDDEALEIGLPCGGEIEVWIEPFTPGRFSEAARGGERCARVIALAPDDHQGVARPHGSLLLEADGRWAGSLGDPALDEAAARMGLPVLWSGRSGTIEVAGRRLFVDVTAPAPRLVIVGAVDLARALCSVARAARWTPVIVDPREVFADPARFPDAERVLALWPEQAFRELALDRATAVAVLTHDPKVDDQALVLALRSPAMFVGALGSRRAQASRRQRLLEQGLSEALLDERLAGPIGLDLGAETPEETALSVMAEIIAARNGRPGGRLRETSGRIHA